MPAVTRGGGSRALGAAPGASVPAHPREAAGEPRRAATVRSGSHTARHQARRARMRATIATTSGPNA